MMLKNILNTSFTINHSIIYFPILVIALFNHMKRQIIYTDPQKKHCTKKKYNSEFSLHLYNEFVFMCNDKTPV